MGHQLALHPFAPVKAPGGEAANRKQRGVEEGCLLAPAEVTRPGLRALARQAEAVESTQAHDIAQLGYVAGRSTQAACRLKSRKLQPFGAARPCSVTDIGLPSEPHSVSEAACQIAPTFLIFTGKDPDAAMLLFFAYEVAPSGWRHGADLSTGIITTKSSASPRGLRLRRGE